MHHKGKVVSRTELIEHIYDQDFDRDSNTIEVFVTRIRKKLGADVITTIRGLGYSLEDPRARTLNEHAAPAAAAAELSSPPAARTSRRRTGSLSRRMIGVAAVWIATLLLIGGFALDRVLTALVVDSFDDQLDLRPQRDDRRRPRSARTARSASTARRPTSASSSPIRVSISRSAAPGAETFRSRSLWDRRLRVSSGHVDVEAAPLRQQRILGPAMPSRCGSPSATSILPGSTDPLALPGRAIARDDRRADPPASLDPVLELPALGVGLLVLAALQTFYGLWPLRRVRRESPRSAPAPNPRRPTTSRPKSRRWPRKSTSCSRTAKRRPRKRAATPATSPMRSRRRSP